MENLIVTLASVFVFALGASIGSFINVVVYRLPAGLSILWPPSRCPHCLNQLKAYDNVPVLGWIWLKGRCRFCKNPISIRYPVVEAMTGIIFLCIFLIFQVSILTLGYWTFCSWLLALSLIDLDTMTLPNALTKSGLVLGLVFQMVVGYASDPSLPGLIRHLMMGIVGAVLGLWLFEAIALLGVFLQKEAMGAGDAKLAAMMGAWLGWRYLLLAGLIACTLGTLVGVGAIMLSKRKWGQKIPFGPFLASGAFITLFGGQPILSAYLQLFF
ncbi:prepilin peptidase [Nostoc parmelioides]|uniref:Prepilin leader peptidase/N-methyltransferase n=1 Tax=Nostoc parmelioides FACHB-3921 TaxID=2692909 RepID=A0ABR8BPA9_9NOSO|nr:A24 family peptidase [Nostoc parmelioides]MBD2255097.1 prepilin peptidase [Nostoc parmelioides FACHB-3921]